MSNQSYLKRLFGRKQTIAEQLAEACDTIVGIIKKGHNEDVGYRYLRILDIANELRGELFQRGLIIIPHDLDCQSESWEIENGRRYTEYRVRTEFTVTDGREKLTYCSFGVGRDLDGKALFIAQTGALKAWLKRLGLIFGEEDDPEIERSREVPYSPIEAVRIGEYQTRAWEAAVRQSGKTKEQIEAYLSTAFGFAVTSEKIASLSRKDFDIAIQWLSRNGDLAETLAISVEAVRKNGKNGKGPQPVVEALDRAKDEVGAD